MIVLFSLRLVRRQSFWRWARCSFVRQLPAASMEAFLEMDPFESMNRAILQAQAATASTPKQDEPPPKMTSLSAMPKTPPLATPKTPLVPAPKRQVVPLPKTPPLNEHDEARQQWLSSPGQNMPAQDMAAAIQELTEAEETADKAQLASEPISMFLSTVLRIAPRS